MFLIGLRLYIKSSQYKKLYVKYKKLNGKSCIQNTKICIYKIEEVE